MAEVNPDYWGKSDYRWFIFGHIQHETVKRIGSVRCESFSQPVAGDAYAPSHFPGGAKSMSSITLHANMRSGLRSSASPGQRKGGHTFVIEGRTVVTIIDDDRRHMPQRVR